MLAAADLQRTGSSFWIGFWDFLWNRQSPATEVPLVSTYSEERLRAYLRSEIAARYDQPPTPAQVIPGSSNFTPGAPGQTMDIDRAVILINDALRSPSTRTVVLSSRLTVAGRPSMETLQLILQNIIDQNKFDGVVGLFLLDLQTSEEIHFAYRNGENLSVNPDVAFTGASTIKIPIMVSVFRRFNGIVDKETVGLLHGVFKTSDNTAADELMKGLDKVRGPLVVTQDMFTLGLDNTFMGGFFCSPQNPCPLLERYKTPANQRTDVDTDPDIYNQTTPADMGMLLEDIYQCAENGGGALVAAFPGQIDQAACQQMIQYLKEDRTGVLLEAGLPGGTTLAHKHGWLTDTDGEYHNFSDAAIIYTPGGDYVLCVYIYDSNAILWNNANLMYADLSRVIYNYFNISSQ
jgi:beta-lactamase class A